MPSAPLRSSVASTLGLAIFGLAALLHGEVFAAPPSEADFRITYFPTDEYGDRRDTALSTFEMNNLIGKARCECDQNLVVRIARDTSSGNTVDAVQVNAYVGQQCATAQAMPGVTQYDPCVQVASGLPAVFQNAPEYSFEPLWLAFGVTDVNNQSLGSAESSGTCGGLSGQGGVWMCAGLTECMMGNFFMQGTANNNVPPEGTPQGVGYDFVPPLTAPTNFNASPGDSAVEISWDATSIADISGYRLLCADAAGNPLDIYDYERPTASDLVTGQHYFTRENLCPGGKFGPDYDPEVDGWPSDETGTDTGSETGTDTSGDTTDTSGDTTDTSGDTTDTSGDTTDTGTETGTDTGSCMIGELGCLCGEGDTCDAGLECSPQGFCGNPAAAAGMLSLDWDYVCSGHISASSQSYRVEGLENGVDYQFLLVAYDFAGNPVDVEAANVIMARPVETYGLWEQCEEQGNVCGEPGFCAVVEPTRSSLVLGLLGLGLVGGVPLLLRARRRRAA
jgi:hypothetical protein